MSVTPPKPVKSLLSGKPNVINAGLEQFALEPGAPLRAAVAGLLGLGPGLTPSGDDVLAGALLGLHANGNVDLAAQLGVQVADASSQGTSPLSAALLRCAIGGETSAALHQAFSAALTNTDWPGESGEGIYPPVIRLARYSSSQAARRRLTRRLCLPGA